MASNAMVLNSKTIHQDLEKWKPQLEAALPRHLNADRLARIALTCCRVNPKLFDTTRESFFGSILGAAQLGFEPGVNGQCYLIPYKQVCTLVPGWKGYMDLVGRTGRAEAWSGAVYDGDTFQFELGSKPFVRHIPGKWAGEENAIEWVYSCGRVNGAEWPIIEVYDIDRIWKHRNKQNKVGDRHYSFAHPEMYARKIPLLQVVKYLPQSIEMNQAAALDVAASEGKQNLTIDMSLNKNFEGGGESDADTWTECESIMQALKWPDEKRESFRKAHDENVKKGLEYLQDEQKRAGKTQAAGATERAKPPAQEQQRHTQPEPQPDQTQGQGDAPQGENWDWMK